MGKKAVRPYLENILDTLKLVEDHTPTDREIFLRDPNAQDATLMRLQDIGEQLARVRDQFPEFFERYHDDDWFKLIGLRNIISHGYHEIDFGIIWDIASSKMPEFTDRMRKIVTDFEGR
jgi:uncharacterized protein with HEPN domain